MSRIWSTISVFLLYIVYSVFEAENGFKSLKLNCIFSEWLSFSRSRRPKLILNSVDCRFNYVKHITPFALCNGEFISLSSSSGKLSGWIKWLNAIQQSLLAIWSAIAWCRRFRNWEINFKTSKNSGSHSLSISCLMSITQHNCGHKWPFIFTFFRLQKLKNREKNEFEKSLRRIPGCLPIPLERSKSKRKSEIK